MARPGDGPVFNQAIVSSHQALAPWLGWVTPLPTVALSELSCRRAQARFLLNEDLMAFFFRQTDGALVGGSGLHSVNGLARRFELEGVTRHTRVCARVSG